MPAIGEITIDVGEEDFLRPVTIWAESTFPTEEREEQLRRFHGTAKDTLQYFNDLVLVAVTYMTNPNAPYRQIGDTTLDVYAAEFEKAASPMRSEAAA